MHACGLAHAGVLERVTENAGDRGSEVFVAHDEAGVSFTDDRGWTAVGSNDGGYSGRQGFEDYIAESIGMRREDEEVHVGIGAGERFAAQDTGEFSSGQMLAQPRLLGTLADDEEAKIGDAARGELLLDLRKEGDILLNR